MNNIQPVLKQLFEAYPNNRVTDGTVAMYLRLLQDIPAHELQTVVDQSVATCKFLPTVAELRDTWHALTRTLGTQSAAEAWGDVQRQIRAVGYIGKPEFENEITAWVVRSIGWLELCASDKPAVDRAQFMRMYDQHVERNEGMGRLLPHAAQFAAERQPGLRQLGTLLPLALPEVGE